MAALHEQAGVTERKQEDGRLAEGTLSRWPAENVLPLIGKQSPLLITELLIASPVE